MGSSSSSVVPRAESENAAGSPCPTCDVARRSAVTNGPEYCIECGWACFGVGRHFRVRASDRKYIRTLLWRYFPLDQRRPSRLRAARLLLSDETCAVLFGGTSRHDS